MVHGLMPIANGFAPTATVATTFFFAVRMTETLREPRFTA